MGYTTTFTGVISIDPPLSSEETDKLNAELDQDLSRMNIGTRWCDWRVTPDGAGLKWNGSEKSYYMPEWLTSLIDRIFIPMGRTLNGEVEASGEDAGDHWGMRVKDNVLEIKKATISWD